VRMECPFTASDVERADRTPVTPRIYANATFEGVKALRVFSEIHLRDVLQGLLATTERERGVLRLYYRLAAYLASVHRLDSPLHFQSIASAARSVFELALDLALLGSDTTTESIERLTAFTRVERYRVAKRLVDFYADHPLPPDFNITQQRRVCADAAEAAAVEALIVQYWGRDRNRDPNWPIHWSRFRDARSRARHVADSWEERYVRYYYVLSWHVHSGAVGVAGLAQEVFDIFVSDAHRLIRDSVIDSYSILGHELHLARAMERWPETLDFLRNVSGFTLVDLRLQALGEPPRFLYLEEHEQSVV
jgi:hypothetical protein